MLLLRKEEANEVTVSLIEETFASRRLVKRGNFNEQWCFVSVKQQPFRRKLEVSEELGIAKSVISRLWQRFQDDGNVSRCYSTGRPRVTTPNEDRYLAVTAKRNSRSTASDLSRQLPVRQFQGRP
ncbi:uncharacterized protein TNCV_3704831 [Trichonephila clavipes]|nr:uncharacterized protein TNCV_3704831 [Trichonephila clavipes]